MTPRAFSNLLSRLRRLQAEGERDGEAGKSLRARIFSRKRLSVKSGAGR